MFEVSKCSRNNIFQYNLFNILFTFNIFIYFSTIKCDNILKLLLIDVWKPRDFRIPFVVLIYLFIFILQTECILNNETFAQRK